MQNHLPLLHRLSFLIVNLNEIKFKIKFCLASFTTYFFTIVMNIENINIPPNSIESEQSVLGGLLLHNEAWDEVADAVNKDDFYTASHRLIFEAIKLLLEHAEPADILTVKERLKKTGDEEVVGGFAYLAQIAENIRLSLAVY
jgi:hypothetical protein